jgi:hypothetical protein
MTHTSTGADVSEKLPLLRAGATGIAGREHVEEPAGFADAHPMQRAWRDFADVSVPTGMVVRRS